MKVLLDHSALKSAAERMFDPSQESSWLEMSTGGRALSFWVTAETVAKSCQWLQYKLGRQAVKEFVGMLESRCAFVPIRKTELLVAVASVDEDMNTNLHINIAQRFSLDGIVTEHPEKYVYCTLPAIHPDEISNFIEYFESRKINKVPFADLKRPYDKIYTEIDERICSIITGSGFILGPHVSEFETQFAKLQAAQYCSGVSNGTAALHIALMAQGIGTGDHVLVPVNTFIATAEAVSLTGATPVFVDCDEYFNIDTEKVRDTIALMASKDLPPPKALIAVHLYGQPANMTEIAAMAAEYDFAVIEDACQAHLACFEGKKVGNFGSMAAFSFYPGKNLGAFGEAGAVITNDAALFEKAGLLRQHGEKVRYQHEVIGHNYRMSAIQGAVLAVKAKYLAEWTRMRQANARRYNDLLAGIEEITLPIERKGTECVYHLYVIQADQRDALRTFLFENGIETGIHYPKALHLQPAYRHLGYHAGDFPVAEKAAQRILSLPMFPELNERQMIYVRDNIKDFYSKK